MAAPAQDGKEGVFPLGGGEERDGMCSRARQNDVKLRRNFGDVQLCFTRRCGNQHNGTLNNDRLYNNAQTNGHKENTYKNITYNDLTYNDNTYST
jgi:hypothetical protein